MADFDTLVKKYLTNKRADREAERILIYEDVLANWTPAEFKTPLQLISSAKTVEPRVDGLWNVGQTGLLFSEAKAGKTTFVHNLVKCLRTGDPFLDMPVTPPKGSIVVYDCELNEDELADWLNKLGMDKLEGVYFASMRGRESHLDFRHVEVRKLLAKEMKPFQPVDMVIVDPMGAVLQSLNIKENDNTVIGHMLRAFNGFLRDDVGASEGLYSHHTGHNVPTYAMKQDIKIALHPRGASAWKDVPDVLWCYEKDDASDLRILSTDGRINNKIQGQYIDFDKSTNHIGVCKPYDMDDDFLVNFDIPGADIGH